MDPFAPADPRPNIVPDEPPKKRLLDCMDEKLDAILNDLFARETNTSRPVIRAKLDALQEVESILLDLDQTPDRAADVSVIRAYMTPLENILNEKE